MSRRNSQATDAGRARGNAPAARGGRPSPPEIASGPAVVASARLKTKAWLEVDGRFVIGDGGLRLLRGVEEHGSLLQASRAMGWSYRHAWGYLRHAEAALGTPLTATRAGKGTSRGMALTEAGRSMIERLAEARRRIDAAVGPSGPTPDVVAARGRPRPHRVRDGDWRRLG